MIDAKMSFLRQVEKECSDKLTVADMGVLMQVFSDVLQRFRMEELQDQSVVSDEMLESFKTTMHVQGRSAHTIKRYGYVVSRFLEYAKTPERNVTVYHLRNWFSHEKMRGIQDSTLDGNREVLSAYFGWLFREGLIEKNPMVNFGVIKVAKKKKKTYSDIDIEKLNKACDMVPEQERQRDRAIIAFLGATGCRISEMTGLDRNTVNFDKLECVVHGKGNKDRTVFMDPVTGMILKEYLDSRKDSGIALFVGKGGVRLEPGGVRCMLKKLGEIAGVDHVHPHKFRRTLATGLAKHGMPIQEICSILGHEKIDTTMKYVNVDQEDTKYDYRRYA